MDMSSDSYCIILANIVFRRNILVRNTIKLFYWRYTEEKRLIIVETVYF